MKSRLCPEDPGVSPSVRVTTRIGLQAANPSQTFRVGLANSLTYISYDSIFDAADGEHLLIADDAEALPSSRNGGVSQ
jgi:hypothetical protein